MALYELRRTVTFDSSTATDVEVYAADRLPLGPLSQYCTSSLETRPDHGCSSSGRSIGPARQPIDLPPSVARLYSGSHQTGRLNDYTMPGMLAWLALNSYELAEPPLHVEESGVVWILFTGSADTAEAELANTTANQYLQLRVSVVMDRRNHDMMVEAVMVDRIPPGPLRRYIVPDFGRDACGRSMRPNRYAIALPPSVKQQYSGWHCTDYVNAYTLPGMLTWLTDNGYVLADLTHILSRADGLWLQYTGSDYGGVDAEVTRGATRDGRAPGGRARAAPRSAAATATSATPLPPKAPVRRIGRRTGRVRKLTPL